MEFHERTFHPSSVHWVDSHSRAALVRPQYMSFLSFFLLTFSLHSSWTIRQTTDDADNPLLDDTALSCHQTRLLSRDSDVFKPPSSLVEGGIELIVSCVFLFYLCALLSPSIASP